MKKEFKSIDLEQDAEEELDKYFPKGDKRRGEVLSIYALAVLKGREDMLKEVLEKIDELKQKLRGKNEKIY